MSKLSKSVGILMEDSEDPKKESQKKKRGQTNVLGCLNKQEKMSWELSNTTWQKETHRRTNRTLIGLRLKVSSGSHRPLGHTSDTPEIEAEQDATMVQQNYRNSCHSGLPKPKVQQRTTSSAGHNPARDPIDPSDPTDLRVPGYDMSTGAWTMFDMRLEMQICSFFALRGNPTTLKFHSAPRISAGSCRSWPPQCCWGQHGYWVTMVRTRQTRFLSKETPSCLSPACTYRLFVSLLSVSKHRPTHMPINPISPSHPILSHPLILSI